MKKYLISITALLCCTFAFNSCSPDNGDENREPEYFDVTSGVFVLNEGNYSSKIDGSLSFIDYQTAQITNGLFKNINNRSLGGTPNSMALLGTNSYIAVTDENRVEVLDMNLKSVAQIKIDQPREVAVDNEYVYVSSYDGCVYKISPEKQEVVAKSEVVGACLEGIACRDGYVYVCNSYNADWTYNNNLVKLKAADLSKVKDVVVECNPTTIKASNKNLYVLCQGNYVDEQARIVCVDENDAVKEICEGTLFDVVNDDLYVINSVTDWTTYETKTDYFTVKNGTKSELKPLTTIPSPCAIAVDPITKYVLISSYNQDANGRIDYSGDGNVYLFNYQNGNTHTFKAGVGPCTLVFRIVTYVY